MEILGVVVAILVGVNTLSNGAQFLIMRDLRERIMRLESLKMQKGP